MPTTASDEYVRKLCNFVRTNDAKLSQSSIQRRRKARPSPEPNPFSLFSWFTPTPQRILLSIDSDRLHNLLLRFEELKLNVGPTDIKPTQPLTRPLFNEAIKDRSETSSIASFRSSLSAISKLSLPVSALFYQQAPIDRELKFLYSSFTRLPSISIHANRTTLSHAEQELYCVPLEVFKTIESLELVDIDPRRVVGWDHLSYSLRIFSMKRCAIEDINDIFAEAVIKDSTRRKEQANRQTDDIPEDVEPPTSNPSQLPPYSWTPLLSLAIPETGLTFIPTLPPMPSLTHLDLSSNLLNSIPSSLAALSSLIHLNLSDNMIDSTLDAKSCVGAITFLDLSKNRLESCAGLEKLLALEKIDLRENQLEEADEIGRLSVIPTLKEVFAEGNLLEEDWRIRCFNRFYQDELEVLLDGTGPSILERRYITSPVAAHNTDASVHDVVPKSPHPVAVSPKVGPSRPSPKPSPVIAPTDSAGKPSSPPHIKHKKRARRVIDIGSDATVSEQQSVSSNRRASRSQRTETNGKEATADKSLLGAANNSPGPQPPVSPQLPRRISKGHSRHATDVALMRSYGGTPSPESEIPHVNFGTVRSKRSLRVSASLHEPSSPDRQRDALDFRARMEALRDQTGDEWLRVLAQREAVTSP